MSGAVQSQFPRLRPVADVGVLVEFGESISEAVHARVLALDAALCTEGFPGFTESIPAFASILVGYDPLVVGAAAVSAHLSALMERPAGEQPEPRVHELPACFEEPFAPDLPDVAERCGLSTEAVVAAHLSGRYRVYMYGFAPGYAYLGGVPEEIQVPRKVSPLRGVPSGTLIVAGPQCLVTTITMPTGWWRIGRCPIPLLRPDATEPFRFALGDEVRFRRIDAAAFRVLSGAADQGPV